MKDLDNGTPGILEADDVNHARFRKIFSHAFSPKALQEQEPIFQKYTSLLIHKLKDKIDGNSQGEFDILAWYKYVNPNMACVEMRMIMVKMLWNFDLKLCNEEEDWLDQPVDLVFKKRPLMVHVRPRDFSKGRS